MSGLHNLKRERVLRTFTRLGWEIVREGANHTIIGNREKPGVCIPIPRHKVIASGTVRSMVKEAGVTLEDFLEAYNG